MIRNLFLFALGSMLVGSAPTSCSEDIPDCPSKMCIVAGGWQLAEVYIDDAKDNIDVSQFRLKLTEPSPTTALTSDFSRTQPSGTTDGGTWSLENNTTILRLIPDNDVARTEDWIIESLTPRQLILVINRDTGIKDGPSKIRFILEPF